GIRDFHVTGVQTCALPICGGLARGPGLVGLPGPLRRRVLRGGLVGEGGLGEPARRRRAGLHRGEDRQVLALGCLALRRPPPGQTAVLSGETARQIPAQSPVRRQPPRQRAFLRDVVGCAVPAALLEAGGSAEGGGLRAVAGGERVVLGDEGVVLGRGGVRGEAAAVSGEGAVSRR